MDSLQDITFSNFKGIKNPDLIERMKSYLRGMQNLVDDKWDNEEKLYYKISTSIQEAHKLINEQSYKKLNDSLFEIHNIHQDRLTDSSDDFFDHNSIYQRQLKKIIIPDDYKKIINDIKKYLNDPDFTKYENLAVFRIELLDKTIGLSKDPEKVQIVEEEKNPDTGDSKFIKKTEMISPLDLQIKREIKTIKHRALIPKFEAYLKLGDIKMAEKMWFSICQNVQNAKHDRRECGLSKQVIGSAEERTRVAQENLEPIQKAAKEAFDQIRRIKPNSKIYKSEVVTRMKSNNKSKDCPNKSIKNLKEDSLKRKFKLKE